MPEVAVIAPLVPVVKGESFDYELIPLHVTLLPNFLIETEIETAVQAVARIAESWKAFEFRATGIDQFGPAADIEVVTIDASDELTKLHKSLREAFSGIGIAVNPEYHGAGYRPHSTTQPGSRVEVGETRVIDRLVLLDCTLPVRTVSSVARLGV
jgi:2'-5' RNA ligase